MKNWKTTTLGVLTIASVVISSAINFLKTGALPTWAEFGLIGAGWAAIQAADASPTP